MVGFEMGLETGGYDMMFTLVALLILGMIFVIIIRGIQQWHHNNQSPRLTVNAKVVSKRTNVSFHHHGHDHGYAPHHDGAHAHDRDVRAHKSFHQEPHAHVFPLLTYHSSD